MLIIPIRISRITPFSKNLIEVLNDSVKVFREKNVLAISSKVISICEGSVVKIGSIEKELLIEREADYFLPANTNQYGITLTIKNNILIPNAGIDESNGAGYYILWPKNPQKIANKIRQYLCKRFNIKKAGVIITDSTTAPLRWGTTGTVVAYSGFRAINSYIGKPDLFGRKMKVKKANIAEGLASAAVAVMGEGKEHTPLVIISDIPFVVFQARNPSSKELKLRHISIQKDVYSLLLSAVKWQKREYIKKEPFRDMLGS